MTTFTQHSANYDETSMQQSILFADSLKDLKNLKTQLYSAAEYFELSYTNNSQKQIVIETLKDYAIKALVNTVDHLGSMTCKVNNLLNENVQEISLMELKTSCVQQRMRMYREYIDQEGMAQQSSIINTPKHHKRYILPVGETIKGANNLADLKFHVCKLEDVDEWYQFKQHAFGATIGEADSPSSSFRLLRKGRSVPPSLRPSKLPGTFSFSYTPQKKDPDRRSVSPHRLPLLRSGSLVTRPTTTPKPSRSITPNPAIGRQQRNPSKPYRSASMVVHDNNDRNKELIQRHPSKSKLLLKSLLSRRKSKKDDSLYTYLDEY